MSNSTGKSINPSNKAPDGMRIPENMDTMKAVDLANALEQTLDSITEDTYDPIVIDAYLEALERKVPTPEKPDAENAFAEFQDKVNALSSNENKASSKRDRNHRFKKILITVTATMVLILALLIGAQAAGLNVFGALAQWTNETFHFIPASANDNNAIIQSALDGQGLPVELAPTWYPPGFEITEEPLVGSNRSLNKVYYTLTNENGKTILVQIMRYYSPDDLELRIFEKDDRVIVKYTSNEKTFYIMTDLEYVSGSWSDGVSFIVSISGNISVSNIKSIIDSIGG